MLWAVEIRLLIGPLEEVTAVQVAPHIVRAPHLHKGGSCIIKGKHRLQPVMQVGQSAEEWVLAEQHPGCKPES
eukprot:scaffold86605_cov18-Tisochrysis_lutea.AAC.1